MTNYEKKYSDKYIAIAELYASMSNCVSIKVGCIIVKNGRILSSGYNGTPPDYINCNEKFLNYNSDLDRKIHHKWSKMHTIHAEMNAILFAAKNGVSILDSIMFVTHQPCWDCSKNIIVSGIKEVYFKYKYDLLKNKDELKKFFIDCNVLIQQLS